MLPRQFSHPMSEPQKNLQAGMLSVLKSAIIEGCRRRRYTKGSCPMGCDMHRK